MVRADVVGVYVAYVFVVEGLSIGVVGVGVHTHFVCVNLVGSNLVCTRIVYVKSRVSISWVSMHLVCTRIVCVNLVRTHFERSNLVCGRIPCVLSVNLVSTCIVNVEKVWYKITSESLI